MTTKQNALLIALSGITLLTGCKAIDKTFDLATYSIFLDEDVDITAYSQQAADILYDQDKGFLSPNASIEVRRLKNIHAPETTSDLAKIIPEQVGIRLSQLGQPTDLAAVRMDDTIAYQGAYTKSLRPSAVLEGNYRRDGTDMIIHLSVTSLANQRIIAAYSFRLPLNRDVAELAQPLAIIEKQ